MTEMEDRTPIGREAIGLTDDVDAQDGVGEGRWDVMPTPDMPGIAATLMAANQWATILTPPAMSVLTALISVTWGEQRAEVILSAEDIRHLLHPDVLPLAEGCIAVLVAYHLVRRRSIGSDVAYALSWRRLVAGGDAAVQKGQGVSRHD